jgi:hypothetical protein
MGLEISSQTPNGATFTPVKEGNQTFAFESGSTAAIYASTPTPLLKDGDTIRYDIKSSGLRRVPNEELQKNEDGIEVTCKPIARDTMQKVTADVVKVA